MSFIAYERFSHILKIFLINGTFTAMNAARKAAEDRLREIGKELDRLQAEFLSIQKRAKDGVLNVMKEKDAKKIEGIRKQLGLK